MTTRRQFIEGTLLATACGCLASCAGGPNPPLATTPVDVGTTADYPRDGHSDRWSRSHGFSLVRDHGKLFAVSTICTHKHCVVKPEKEEWECPCHGSRFTRAGAVLEGPAKRPLPHLAISLDAAAHIIVDPRQNFDQVHWGEPGTFVAIG